MELQIENAHLDHHSLKASHVEGWWGCQQIGDEKEHLKFAELFVKVSHSQNHSRTQSVWSAHENRIGSSLEGCYVVTEKDSKLSMRNEDSCRKSSATISQLVAAIALHLDSVELKIGKPYVFSWISKRLRIHLARHKLVSIHTANQSQRRFWDEVEN